MYYSCNVIFLFERITSLSTFAHVLFLVASNYFLMLSSLPHSLVLMFILSLQLKLQRIFGIAMDMTLEPIILGFLKHFLTLIITSGWLHRKHLLLFWMNTLIRYRLFINLKFICQSIFRNAIFLFFSGNFRNLFLHYFLCTSMIPALERVLQMLVGLDVKGQRWHYILLLMYCERKIFLL